MESAGHDHPITSTNSGKGLAQTSIRDVLMTATLAAVIAIGLRLFVLGTFAIPSHSMENTLLPGDQILVSKLPMWFGGMINRGDIVVFNMPDSLRGSKPDEAFIKRVIGMPGDTVSLTPFGITINNHLIPDPPYSAHTAAVDLGRRTIVVPEGEYFLLGDNRANSWDSRYWGTLPESSIVGTPLVVFWSSPPDSSNSSVRWNRILTRVE